MINYAYTILYVNNVEKSIEFYEQAFDFKRKFITPEHDYAELSSGATTISFVSINLAKSNLSEGFMESKKDQKPFGIELAFATEQINEYVQKALMAGATEVEKIKTKPWGQKVAYVKDPDGFLIEICTPVKQ